MEKHEKHNQLGCIAILKECIEFDEDEYINKHRQWTRDKIINILINEFNFKIKKGNPRPGDIVFSGIHPGLVLSENKIKSIVKGKTIISNLNNWKIEVILCQ